MIYVNSQSMVQLFPPVAHRPSPLQSMGMMIVRLLKVQYLPSNKIITQHNHSVRFVRPKGISHHCPQVRGLTISSSFAFRIGEYLLLLLVIVSWNRVLLTRLPNKRCCRMRNKSNVPPARHAPDYKREGKGNKFLTEAVAEAVNKISFWIFTSRTKKDLFLTQCSMKTFKVINWELDLSFDIFSSLHRLLAQRSHQNPLRILIRILLEFWSHSSQNSYHNSLRIFIGILLRFTQESF